MDLNINQEQVGHIYFNIQLDKTKLIEKMATNLKNKTMTDVLNELKSTKYFFNLNNQKLYIKSFRKFYTDEEHIYFEGAEIDFE
jgi:hypothetical protein